MYYPRVREKWACRFRAALLTPSLLILFSLQRSVSDNTLVAMDFSGHAGRVIENPQEALNAATEEAQAWRVRPSHTYASAVLAPNGLSWREGGKGLGDPVNAKGSLTSMSSIAEEDKPPSQPAHPVLRPEPQCRWV